MFKGKVYEKETNKLLNIHRKTNRINPNKFKFIFKNNIYPEKIDSRTKIYFDEQFLVEHILNMFNDFASSIKEKPLFIKKINYKFCYLKKTIKSNLDKLKEDFIETRKSIRNMYVQFIDNTINFEEYLFLRNCQKDRIKNLENEITLNNIKYNNVLTYHKNCSNFLKIILKNDEKVILDRNLILLSIEKIIVDCNKNVDLKFKINFYKLAEDFING